MVNLTQKFRTKSCTLGGRGRCFTRKGLRTTTGRSSQRCSLWTRSSLVGSQYSAYIVGWKLLRRSHGGTVPWFLYNIFVMYISPLVIGFWRNVETSGASVLLMLTSPLLYWVELPRIACRCFRLGVLVPRKLSYPCKVMVVMSHEFVLRYPNLWLG